MELNRKKTGSLEVVIDPDPPRKRALENSSSKTSMFELEGSFRKEGYTLRIAVELNELQSKRIMWAELYEGNEESPVPTQEKPANMADARYIPGFRAVAPPKRLILEVFLNMPQRKAFLCFASLIFFALGAFFTLAQTSAPTSPAAPQYSSGPVTNYDSAVPDFSDVLRFRRGERYNTPNPSLPELGEGSETESWDLPETHFKKDPMPFDGSDAVVVGTVSAGHAYLSNDKRSIYSEFKFKIREGIKTPSAQYLQAGDSIDIQRKGGAIRLQSGKVLVRGALADSMPLVGKRYLLFLKYDQATEDYGILTGYELEGNEIYRLDDLSYGESNHQKIIHTLRKEGVTEDQFLDRAKSKLSRKNGGS